MSTAGIVTAAAPRAFGAPARARLNRAEIVIAVAAFAGLCAYALATAPRLLEPDDYAYLASVVALSQGHLTLSTSQYHALAASLARSVGGFYSTSGIVQWVHLSSGRWISEKDPGYPFLALPFQLLHVIRLAPLCYGALACVGLFLGARAWLGRYAGAAAVGLYCTSGAALVFAWRDYMPTFTGASLIAAGTGFLLWAVLAGHAVPGRRIGAGLAGFVALEAAVFTRYTDILALGCATLAVIIAGRSPAVRLPARALWWWLGSVAAFGAGLALFDDLVYGGPLQSGYRAGEITFSLSAVVPNLRLMPGELIRAMPVLLLGLAALAWIVVRTVRLGQVGGEVATAVRRDFAVGVTLAASWFSIWALYAGYTWTTTQPASATVHVIRFYVPALGAISLLGAWLVTRLTTVPRRAAAAAPACVAVLALLFAQGAWSANDMRAAAMARPPGRPGLGPGPGGPGPLRGRLPGAPGRGGAPGGIGPGGAPPGGTPPPGGAP